MLELEKVLDKNGLIYYDGLIKEFIENLITEINQNLFSNIKVGSTTISANKKMNTLMLESGDNIVKLSADKDKNKITISLDASKLVVKSETKPMIVGTLGDIVYNSNPISGDYIGWTYTLSGWVGFGKIEIVDNGIELSDGSALVLSNDKLFLTAD